MLVDRETRRRPRNRHVVVHKTQSGRFTKTQQKHVFESTGPERERDSMEREQERAAARNSAAGNSERVCSCGEVWLPVTLSAGVSLSHRQLGRSPAGSRQVQSAPLPLAGPPARPVGSSVGRSWKVPTASARSIAVAGRGVAARCVVVGCQRGSHR